jgi:hypothetical protein
MIQSAQIEARRLTELLIQQRDVYLKLRELATAQTSAVQDERPEELLRILGDRQRRITELLEINTQLEPFRSRWGELRQAMGRGERLEVGELVEEVQGLLSEILRQDEGDCDALRQRTESNRSAAAAAVFGQRANAAYTSGQCVAGGSRYVDCNDQERGQP